MINKPGYEYSCFLIGIDEGLGQMITLNRRSDFNPLLLFESLLSILYFRIIKIYLLFMMKRIFLGLLCASINLCMVAQNRVTKVFIPGAKGLLAAEIQMPENKGAGKCPIAILAHGFGGDKNWQLMKMVSDSLQMYGIASIRFDFNGHGESEGDFEDMTVPNEIEDLKHVVRYALQLDECNGKIGLLGHSQGGVVVSMAAGEMNDTISAVALLAPAAVLREDVIRGNTFGVPYNPVNPSEYVELPGGYKLGREYILTAFRLPIYETAIRYQGVASLIHGTGDRVAPYSYSERYKNIWKNSELHLMEEYDHGFSQNIEEVANLVSGFFIKHLQ